MLSPKEFEQIKAAIDMAYVYVINQRDYTDKHNVIALLSKFVEPDNSEKSK